MTVMFVTGDTAPALTGKCNASLVGATVRVNLRKPDGTTITRAATITDAATGTWSMAWQAGDLAMVGAWFVEAQVTYSDQTVQTFGGPEFFEVREQVA